MGVTAADGPVGAPAVAAPRSFRPLDWIAPGASASLLAELAVALVTFPASVLLNRALGAHDRGLLALITVLPMTLFALGSCQWDRLAAGLVTAGRLTQAEADRRTLAYALRLSLLVVPAAAAGVLAFQKVPWALALPAAVFCLNFPLQFVNISLWATAAAAGRLKLHYALRLGTQMTYLGGLALLAAAGALGIPAVVAVYLLMNAAGIAIAAAALPGFPSRPPSDAPLEPLQRGFVPYALQSVAERVDLWALALFSSTATLGLYAGARALSVPMGIVSGALATSSAARVPWRERGAARRYAARMLVFMAAVAVVLVGAAVLWGEALLVWLLGGSFAGGGWMLPWVAVAVVAQAAAHHLGSALRQAGRQRAYLGLQAGGALASIVVVLAMGAALGARGILMGVVVGAVLAGGACGVALLAGPHEAAPPAGSEAS